LCDDFFTTRQTRRRRQEETDAALKSQGALPDRPARLLHQRLIGRLPRRRAGAKVILQQRAGQPAKGGGEGPNERQENGPQPLGEGGGAPPAERPRLTQNAFP
jgi:hypothetical protein